MDEGLGTPEQIAQKIHEYADTAPPVAECFRCGRSTPFDYDVGEPCQRDGCAGRYIKTAGRCPTT